MAYAFDKIMSMVDPTKANIFGGQDGSQGGSPQPGSPGVEKTSAGADISGGQSASQPKASFVAPLPVQPQAKAPKLLALTDAGQKITTNQERLQQEANQYTANQTAAQKYDVPSSDIESALGGDQEKSNKIFNTLQQAKPTVEGFKPTEMKYETEGLSSDAGVQKALRKQASPRYTMGSSAYDLALLKKDPGFSTNLRQLQGREQDLENQYKNLLNPESGLQSQVEKVGKNELEQAKANIRKYLAAQSAKIENENYEQSAAFNERLKNLEGDTGNALEEYLRSKGFDSSTIKPDLQMAGIADPELAKYLTPEAVQAFGIDPYTFAKITGKPTTAADFMSQDEANRFNKIVGLLGGKEVVQAAEEPKEFAAVDDKAYLDAILREAKNRNTAANIKAEQTIKDIMGRASGAAKQSEGFVTDQAIQNMIASDAARARGLMEGEIVPSEILPDVDPSQFWRSGGVPTSWTQFLTEDEARSLNEASEELLDPRRFNAGEFGQKFNAGSFDYGAYQEALRKALAARAGVPSESRMFPLPISSI